MSWCRAVRARARPPCSNALIELLPEDERIVSIEDTLELRMDWSNCVRSEARGIDSGSVTIRDLVRHALRHRPDHIAVGEVRGREAADLLQALNTGHGGSLITIHANNAESALSRLASCAMQGGGDLPREVPCRGVVDGISMVIHMARREGRRFVEERVAPRFVLKCVSSEGWHVQWETRQTRRGKSQSPVAWVALVEETKPMKPTNKAMLGMVSKSSGRNESEPMDGLENEKPRRPSLHLDRACERNGVLT